jgi:hypothetical protein
VATLEVYGPGATTQIYWSAPGPPNAPAG